MLLPLLVCAPLVGDVEELRDEHAAALTVRAEVALEQRLYLDAERCALAAREWDADVAGVDALLQAVQDGRRAHVEAEAEQEYRSYLDSKAYTKAREQHDEALAELREEHAERALELARDAEDPTPALRLALDLEVDEKAAKRAVGKKFYAAVREAWEAERGLAVLELGERVMGAPLEEDALEGKVVVWRSFSL